MTANTPSIPIINFSAWTSEGSPSQRLAVAKDLVKACQDTGFAYISNHGVFAQTLNEAFAWAQRFFDLEHEQKIELVQPEGSIGFRGYCPPGSQKAIQLDVDEETAQALRATADINGIYNYGSDGNNRQPNIWLPESIFPDFKEFTVKFYSECWHTSQLLLRALALGLGIDDEDYFFKFHDNHGQQVTFRHYMPVAAAEIESGQKDRLGAHTDFGSVTLLFQDDCGSLEVENPQEPGKFIHFGMHRVRLPPLPDRYTGALRMTCGRYSIPFFVLPNLDAIIECVPACYDEKTPAKYAPISWAEYLQMRANLLLETA
ncbi:Clavaminate synthase-like protein [Stipitochalara longipes BDJ]|nr:Clavaminate synthase-like protein [Stipitochalara longipes BDJ]